MNYAAPLPENEAPSRAALFLSASVHLLLIGALFFGVQWKSKAPVGVEVEIWRASSAPLTPPAPPRVEPKLEPRPDPKPEPKAQPLPPVKPDISIKDKEKPKKEEPDRRPNYDEELKRELKQTQQQKAAQAQRERVDAELKADAASASRNRGLATYGDKIRGKVRGNIVLPPGIVGNPEAVFEVTQLPTGEVINVKLRKSSGNRLLDESIERAILKSSPLPKPDDPALFQRVLELKYKPLDE